MSVCDPVMEGDLLEDEPAAADKLDLSETSSRRAGLLFCSDTYRCDVTQHQGGKAPALSSETQQKKNNNWISY